MLRRSKTEKVRNSKEAPQWDEVVAALETEVPELLQKVKRLEETRKISQDLLQLEVQI